MEMCRIPFFRILDSNRILVGPNYFFVRNTTFLARQYNWSNMFNTIITCRLSHYFRLKTCSSFLSHSQVLHLMFVVKYVTVLSGKYPANFTRIPDSAGCLHFTGYRIVLSGSDTSLIMDHYLLTFTENLYTRTDT